MNSSMNRTLAVALSAALGLVAAPAVAQHRAHAVKERVQAQQEARRANADAKEAREEAKEAQVAARVAAQTGDADAKAAHHASVAAQDAKNDAVEASQRAQGSAEAAVRGVNAEEEAAATRGAANASSRAREQAAAASAVARSATDVDVPVTAPVPTVTVPVSPNASENARIATSAPGAMAAHRHMSGAGRYHLDTALLDTNRDGFLSQAEVAGNVSLTTHFAAIDTNTDTRLAADELRTWIAAGGLSKNARPLGDVLAGTGLSADARFDMLDVDNDGMLTSKEAGMAKGLRSSFRTLDRNRDGRLSGSEFSAWTTTGR